MLVKSLYPYKGPFDGSLSFTPDEIFLKIREENKHWFLVSKADGTIGCVPGNYMKALEVQNQATIAKWATRTLAFLKNSTSQLKDRDAVFKALSDLAATRDENVCSDTTPANAPSSTPPIHAPLPQRNTVPKPGPVSPMKTQPQRISLPGGLAARLVDILRLGTNASFSECRDTFRVFLEVLASDVPDLRPYADVLEVMLLESTSDQRISAYLQSPDWYVLRHYFNQLNKRAADSQESGWRLHEDAVQYEVMLDSLRELLTKANPELILHYLKCSNFEPLQWMIRVYQNESRPHLRRKLLLVLGHSCTLDSACLDVAMTSVLPLEMIRELGSITNQSDISHISTLLRLLTILVARTSHLPVDFQNSLTLTFYTKVLQLIGEIGESDDSSDSVAVLFAGQLAHAATTFLLACNWHFCSLAAKRSQSTMVPLLSALKANPFAARYFIELVVHAFNRGFDPIFLVKFSIDPDPKHLERLIRWTELIPSGTCTENGSEFIQNSGAIQSLFPLGEHTSVASMDDGLYARTFWSDSFRTHARRNKQPVTLPASVSPTTPKHSVLKLVFDLFSSAESAQLVYDSDQDVIIDVIDRQLREVAESEDDQILEYPILLGLVIANSNFLTRGAHRSEELIESLEALLDNDQYNSGASFTSKRSLDLARISLERLRLAVST